MAEFRKVGRCEVGGQLGQLSVEVLECVYDQKKLSNLGHYLREKYLKHRERNLDIIFHAEGIMNS